MTGEPSKSVKTNNTSLQETSGQDADASCVQVAVRVRPMLPSEAGSTQCVEVLSSNSKDLNVVRLGGQSGPKFTFDEVIPLTADQLVIYEHRVAPLVTSCLEGYNATIFAYGQTGSGKTHTMIGPSSSLTNAVQDELHAGVIPRAIHNIFRELEENKHDNANDENRPEQRGADAEEEESSGGNNDGFQYEVRVQFLEVYGEDIRDLLTSHQPSQKLLIRDVGVDEPEVIGATQEKVDSAEEALLCLTRGMFRRVTGSTAMNASSSRSHAILSLLVEQSKVLDDGPQTGVSDADAKVKLLQAKRSKFHFVDLAGSERQKRTMAEGHRLKEGIDINKGLLVLGNVISALGDPKKQGKTFVPYRDSKLTRLLKGSLGGNHKTLMIACVSPSSNNTEETLNCLRYANRAKNIQNHAVVNIDSTSHLISELRGKVQALASDLLKAHDGDISACTFPPEVLQSLANGGDGNELITRKISIGNLASPSKTPTRPQQRTPVGDFQRTQNLLRQTISDCNNAEERLHAITAEKEMYRLQLAANSAGDDINESLQQAFTARISEYEREIAELKLRLYPKDAVLPQANASDSDKPTLRDDRMCMPQLPPRTPQRRIKNKKLLERAESPELSRLRAQVFGSMSHSDQLDAEVEAEEKALTELTTKYGGHDDENNENDDSHHQLTEKEDATQIKLVSAGHQQLEADIYELSHSIVAKEELIQQLQASQDKYEAMREFYEAKLHEMEQLLLLKESESEKLSEDLKKLDVNQSGSRELAERLKKKQEHIAELKKKQRELLRLTSVASKNESQIAKLRNDVIAMKQKKVNLQKQISDERKSHALAVQKLKKESIQKDREFLKLKKISDRNAFQAQRAQQMAKTRLEQMGQLKAKYKDAEKRLRMQTVKRGVMQKAGLDPVMVGRRGSKKPLTVSNVSNSPPAKNEIDFDKLRNFFDQKVADVGRREALAEKLAQEWEEHLELSTRRQELAESTNEESSEVIKSLDSQIVSKEERIRQVAGRLRKRKLGPRSDDSSESENFLFDKDFRSVVGGASPMTSMKISAKVLFGMIVRERRRIASLARTASCLDEKVQEAEAATKEKDSAFRAYVEEQQHEVAMLAQNQQEQILSLMDMVRDGSESMDEQMSKMDGIEGSITPHVEGGVNPKLLVLANERISVLERQLRDVQLAREAMQQRLEREEVSKSLLDSKKHECDELQEELSGLRSSLRQIRDTVAAPKSESVPSPMQKELFENYKLILDIVSKSLHPICEPSIAERRRSSTSKKVGVSKGIIPRLRHVDLMDTSESEGVPDWAEDIMEDLATIAEGKMPSSLRRSSGLRNAEAKLEKNNVFDRLTRPNSFTGVQTQKKTKVSHPKNVRSSSVPPDYDQRQRKIISKQVADSLDKVIVPDEKSLGQKRDKKKFRKEGSSSTKGIGRSSTKRSVFDRLLSPSNLTGTQKQKYQQKKGIRSRSGGALVSEKFHEAQTLQDEKSHRIQKKGGDSAEKLLDDLLIGDEEVAETFRAEHRGSHGSKLDGYTQQNVFERLQKTTTQAYAVKQHVNIAEKMLHDLLDSQETEEVESPKADQGSGFERVDEYAQQNVFERLQKNTTHSYAGKQHVNVAGKMLGNIFADESGGIHTGVQQTDHESPSRNRAMGSPPESSHKKRNVFERLQTTTTEAYAKKKPPPLQNLNAGSSPHEISGLHQSSSEVRALFS